jgi:hypothetical protein
VASAQTAISSFARTLPARVAATPDTAATPEKAAPGRCTGPSISNTTDAAAMAAWELECVGDEVFEGLF